VLCCAALTVVVSCRKEPTTWSTLNSIPLANGRLYLTNIIPDSLLQADSDGMYKLKANYELLRFDPTEDIAIPDTVISKLLAIPFSLNVSPGIEFINDTEESKFSGEDAELVEIEVFTGNIEYEILNPISQPIIVTYLIPNATKNGVSFSYSDTLLPGSIASPSVNTGTVVLDGYTFNLRGINGNEYNTIQTQIKAKTAPYASPVLITTAHVVQVKARYSEMVPAYARGYFGNIASSESSAGDTLDFFNVIKGGSFDLDDVQTRLIIKNQIGTDAQVTIHQLTGINTVTGSNVSLSHSIIAAVQNITRAQDLSGFPQAHVKSYDILSSNSNIEAFVESMPDRLAYDVSFAMNPLGNVTGHNDFVYRNYPFTAELEIETPLRFGASGLMLSDTLKVNDFLSDETAERIEWAELEINVINAFPLEADFTLILPDGFGNYSDTVYVSPSQAQAGIQGLGTQISPVASQLKIKVSRDQLKNIDAHKSIVVWFTFSTPSGLPVTFYTSHYLDCSIVLNMKNLWEVR
jgi:hypothetical protein